MDVTWMLQCLRIVPNELAITPFPTPLITPPVTRMYFIIWQDDLLAVLKEYLASDSHAPVNPHAMKTWKLLNQFEADRSWGSQTGRSFRACMKKAVLTQSQWSTNWRKKGAAWSLLKNIWVCKESASAFYLHAYTCLRITNIKYVKY